MSTMCLRTFVPGSLRRSVIEYLQKLAHPGVKATTKIVKQRYFWPSVDHDIKDFVR